MSEAERRPPTGGGDDDTKLAPRAAFEREVRILFQVPPDEAKAVEAEERRNAHKGKGAA
jgi:hypothetical protein